MHPQCVGRVRAPKNTILRNARQGTDFFASPALFFSGGWWMVLDQLGCHRLIVHSGLEGSVHPWAFVDLPRPLDSHVALPAE